MELIIWNFISIFCGFHLLSVDGVYSPAQETAIRTQIFTNNSYDYVSRPDAQTNIKVSLSLLAIEELDLKTQSMLGSGWFTFADITYYPYDQQKCAIDVISWGYTVEEVTLEAARTGIYLDDFETNGEWSVTKSSVELNNVTEVTSSGATKVHPQLRFFIHLQRRTSFYNLNVMIPSVITSMLVVLVFVVPDESGEKLSYVLTVFLSIAVLLTLIADSMPPTSITVSVLALYLAIVLILSGLAVVFTVGVMILAKREGYMTQPSCLYSITSFAAKVTRHPNLMKSFSRATSSVAPKEDNDSEDSSGKNIPYLEIQWKEASEILDKFCFYIFLVLSLVMNFSFVIALTVGGSVNEPD